MKRKFLGGLLGCMLVGQVFAADSGSGSYSADTLVISDGPFSNSWGGSYHSGGQIWGLYPTNHGKAHKMTEEQRLKQEQEKLRLATFGQEQRAKYVDLKDLQVATDTPAFLAGFKAVPSVLVNALGCILPEACGTRVYAFAESIQPEGYYPSDAAQQYESFLQFGSYDANGFQTWLCNVTLARLKTVKFPENYEYQQGDYDATADQVDRHIAELRQSKIAAYSSAPRVWAKFLSVAIPTAAVGLGVAVKSYWPQISSMLSNLLVKKAS